ncbi:hypothetical protein HMPREF3069_29150 [Achromobacter xylosoxidans]|nr:hypothetical protein HMPREF2772_15685 [Achromobacter xylosoxidans]OFS31460.1 hypothetical protein HMPREF3069_29150 [Achromobacter xylosoxidans]CUI39157.1 Uncharacterised protein [Achromobacter xylosoxidans]CUI59402.1 Uncharacterised protein [Achromobacter xylosoxidans]
MDALARTLTGLSHEASNELDAARAAGDQNMIDRASRKHNQLWNAGWFVFEKLNMEDLWNYVS